MGPGQKERKAGRKGEKTKETAEESGGGEKEWEGRERSGEGEVLDGTATIQALGERMFQLMLDTASGKRSRSETHGYGQNEFVPWQLSVIT